MRGIPSYAGFAVLLVLCLSATGQFALADDDGGDDQERGTADRRSESEDYDRILKSAREGKILPLARLKAVVLARWPGELLDVSIHSRRESIIYEFRIVRDDGKLTEVEVDAANGKIIEVENE